MNILSAMITHIRIYIIIYWRIRRGGIGINIGDERGDGGGDGDGATVGAVREPPVQGLPYSNKPSLFK